MGLRGLMDGNLCSNSRKKKKSHTICIWHQYSSQFFTRFCYIIWCWFSFPISTSITSMFSTLMNMLNLCLIPKKFSFCRWPVCWKFNHFTTLSVKAQRNERVRICDTSQSSWQGVLIKDDISHGLPTLTSSILPKPDWDCTSYRVLGSSYLYWHCSAICEVRAHCQFFFFLWQPKVFSTLYISLTVKVKKCYWNIMVRISQKLWLYNSICQCT